MSLLEAVRLALQTIRVQKLKSFFTLLGVTIGVMFLIAVVSIIEGMGRYMEEDLVGKLLAVNTFELRRRPNMNFGNVTEDQWREWQRRPFLYETDVPAVAEALPEGTRWAPVGQAQLLVSSRYSKAARVQAMNTTPTYFTIKRLGVSEGRVFTEQENALGLPVVVIGQDIKDRYFPTVDAIGRELRIGDIPYTVIGVAEKQGSALGNSFDRFVIAPFRSPMRSSRPTASTVGK